MYSIVYGAFLGLYHYGSAHDVVVKCCNDVFFVCLRRDVPKLYLYSAHDSLVCPVLEALGAYDDVWPPFASNITFELLENKVHAVLYTAVVCACMLHMCIS